MLETIRTVTTVLGGISFVALIFIALLMGLHAIGRYPNVLRVKSLAKRSFSGRVIP